MGTNEKKGELHAQVTVFLEVCRVLLTADMGT